MTERWLPLVSMVLVGVVVIASRWTLRVRAGDWQARREIPFVALLVGGFAGVAAIGAVDPALRSVLLGLAAVGLGLWQRATMRSPDGKERAFPIRIAGPLLIVAGLGAIIIGVVRTATGV